MDRESVSFQARARTIDHLGKGQIADAPTAISELWKNSYDAYARDVALHLFDGDIQTGAIIDNGCGMTFQQLIDSWLVIGTESKTLKKLLPKEDRFGLEDRSTQGEKGIGRLSAAFLAPVTLLITKKINSLFSVALIDWRFFENPYLSLHDIKVPMSEVTDLTELNTEVPLLISELKRHFNSDDKNIINAWSKYSTEQIKNKNKNKNKDADSETTESKIKYFCDNYNFDSSVLDTWISLLDKAEELDENSHGTALILLDLSRELGLLSNPENLAADNEELSDIKSSIIDTLRSFYDPFEQDKNTLNYEIKTFSVEKKEQDILRQHDVFTKDDFNALEHKVDGYIDHKGWFKGRVTAFGIDQGEVIIPPNIPIPERGTQAGSFQIRIGSYETESLKTSLEPDQKAVFDELKTKHSGILIFRDSLRVQPYGRTRHDFFNIEERRGYSAGRHFWASRKTFGNISITHTGNPKLLDKAGREGFVINQASRELKSLVEGLLIHLADKYFGGRSDIRKQILAIISKEKEQKKQAQNKARRVSTKDFTNSLKAQTPKLTENFEKLKSINIGISSEPSSFDLKKISKEFEKLESTRTDLKTPTQPPKLGKHEDSYRLYKDTYNEFSELLRVTSEKLNKITSKLTSFNKPQEALTRFEKNQAFLNIKINKFINRITKDCEQLLLKWQNNAAKDRKEYNKQAIKIVEEVTEDSNLNSILNALDSIYIQLSDDYSVRYDGIIKAINRLSEDINLEYAFSIAEEERINFEEKVNQIQSLAQLGISVEVLAHELEAQDGLVTRGLNSLPSDIKEHPGYQTAYNAHKALTSHIRFLAPLKLSGYQARQEITGKDIYNHILRFFRDRFERQRIDLSISNDFFETSISDLPSRIYPVFINILNNALYWVCLGKNDQRVIKIGVIEGNIVIANSGPPVHPDDAENIFEIFTTKRANGNGVGLYLCRVNLLKAHHTIKYELDTEKKLIKDGANFTITFHGMEIK
ncbi:MAG: signal transduction histidine kinase [Oceanicoccus sp.]|jgi:signal transduction histidine kinase